MEIDEIIEDDNRWYHSSFGFGLGLGLAALGIGLGFGGCTYLSDRYLSNRSTPKIIIVNHPHSKVQQKDFNNNGVLETYHEIDGVKYFSEIDGKSLESNLDQDSSK